MKKGLIYFNHIKCVDPAVFIAHRVKLQISLRYSGTGRLLGITNDRYHCRVPRHPSAGTMPTLRPRRLSENKTATSAITSLRDDELTERATVTKIIFSRYGHSPKTVLLWKQASTRQRGLHDGPASAGYSYRSVISGST